VYERLGDVRSIAVTKGKIADILEARGQFDDALDIRQNDELPVYERLGDVRSIAVTKGKIADILEARGQFDDALDIRQNDVLPVFERIGDRRTTAIILRRIADLKEAKGDPAAAISDLRRATDTIPDEHVRDIAIFQSRIAEILEAQGDLAEAHRTRKGELQIVEAIGDDWTILVALDKLADLAQQLGRMDEAAALRQRLREMDPAPFGPLWSALLDGKAAWLAFLQGNREAIRRVMSEVEIPAYDAAGKSAWSALVQVRLAWLDVVEGADPGQAHAIAAAKLAETYEVPAADRGSLARAHLLCAELGLLAGESEDTITRIEAEVLSGDGLKPNLARDLEATAQVSVAAFRLGRKPDLAGIMERLERAIRTGAIGPVAWASLAAGLVATAEEDRTLHLSEAETGFAQLAREGWVAKLRP
ncbi:MAG: tetratricopeptide repeat protein, partial [Pseudomonadota bacterium]